jgi:hypothetical protein
MEYPRWNVGHPQAVDIEVLDEEASVYVLYDDGFIQTPDSPFLSVIHPK